MRSIRRHYLVPRDIIDLADYIALDSLDAAIRFFAAAEATIESLTEFPGKGSIRNLSNPRLADVRSWKVKGFPNHLIIYEFTDAAVTVHAVIHGARNFEELLEGRT